MNKLFEINKKQEHKEDDVLLCEISDTYACIARYSPQSTSITALDYYTFSGQQAAESAKKIFDSSFLKSTNKKIIGAAFGEAVLVPNQLYREEATNHFLIETNGCQLLTDKIPEWQMINTYTMPSVFYNLLSKDGTIFFHTYTPTLKIYNGFDAEHQVMVHFSPLQFRVMVKRVGRLQLAQTYAYAVPLDVVYYLLSIYQQFDLPKEDTFLLLSGLVEKDSALYKELENYFLNIHFHSPANNNTLDDLPSHYFTSLYNLAACAL